MNVPHLAFSSGSACTSGALEPSYVIGALGLPHELVHTALRLVTGRFTTMQEVVRATGDIIGGIKKLRLISPIWSMKQAGIDLDSIKWTE
jgi:cysteine desulfurase